MLVGGDERNMTGLFFRIFGMSSSQLTFIFFRGVEINHQPEMIQMDDFEMGFYHGMYSLVMTVTVCD